MRVIVPQGGYFVLADTSNFDYDYDPREQKDFEFARWLIHTHKLGPIPPSAFYSFKNKYIVKDYARFAFCKSDTLIEAGLEKLKRIKR
jgi:aspartate/methionine/tyrosine aminotransferase